MSKVQSHHLERPAYVYVRQSTMGQVRHHHESTERQYALRNRAVRDDVGAGANPDPRPGSRTVGSADDRPRGFQDAGRRRVPGTRRGHLRPGSVAAGPLQPRMASVDRDLRADPDPRHRRGWLLRPRQLQTTRCCWGSKPPSLRPSCMSFTRASRAASSTRPRRGSCASPLPVGPVLRRRGAHRARSGPGGPGRGPARLRPLPPDRQRLRGRAPLRPAATAVPQARLRRRVGRQTHLGTAEPQPSARHPQEPLVCRRVCLRALPERQGDLPRGRRPHAQPVASRWTPGPCGSRITTMATSAGRSSSGTNSSSRTTAPTPSTCS